MCGLMLALASTGNLVMSYGDVYRYVFGVLSSILLLLLVFKALLFPKTIAEGFSNPVIASVMPTFSMGVMIISTYLKAYFPIFSYILWLSAIVLHIILIGVFSTKYLFNFNMKGLFPSYFVVYVGIVVASVTAPVYGKLFIGQSLFWFGLASYLILLPFVLYRVFIVKGIPEPALPTITILAAPAGLLLAGYLNSFSIKNVYIVNSLLCISIIMLVLVAVKLPRLLKLPFYPSFSAFTFPFVITSIALKGTNAYFINTGKGIALLGHLVRFMEVWSVIIVVYVLIRYTFFFILPFKSNPPLGSNKGA
ncbi:TDT family transporter [Alkalicella caledoniensis]